MNEIKKKEAIKKEKQVDLLFIKAQIKNNHFFDNGSTLEVKESDYDTEKIENDIDNQFEKEGKKEKELKYLELKEKINEIKQTSYIKNLINERKIDENELVEYYDYYEVSQRVDYIEKTIKKRLIDIGYTDKKSNSDDESNENNENDYVDIKNRLESEFYSIETKIKNNLNTSIKSVKSMISNDSSLNKVNNHVNNSKIKEKNDESHEKNEKINKNQIKNEKIIIGKSKKTILKPIVNENYNKAKLSSDKNEKKGKESNKFQFGNRKLFKFDFDSEMKRIEILNNEDIFKRIEDKIKEMSMSKESKKLKGIKKEK